ncbi:MAG: OmpA family protein [Bacteroidetes bacterium]|nr:OmpA family protein [Bacteroidota bacterium]
MKKLLSLLALLFSLTISSQDYLGLQTSNYAGVMGVYSNPANIVNSRMKFDMVLTGLNVTVDNNYMGIKRDALKYSESIFNPSGMKFPGSWDTLNNNSPYYYKNNFIKMDNNQNKSIYFTNRITLPSFMISINSRNAISFNWSLRNYVNLDGISPDLATLAYNEFKYPSLWVTKLQNQHFSMQQMMWAEYGLTYARVIKDNNQHFFKAGVTVKLLQGLNATYVYIDNLKYQFNTQDTVSFFNSQVNYGHSSNLDPMVKSIRFDQNNQLNSLLNNYKFQSYPGFGFDFGGVYEWRPDYEKHKYDMDGEKGLWRNDQNKYKLKASFAINDIGSIRFDKGILSNNFNANIGLWNLHPIKVNSVGGFDTLMNQMFQQNPTSTTFRMMLPTSINANIDYHIWKPFYVNLLFNMANLAPNRLTEVHDFTTLSLAPRFDHKWFGVTLPITYNSLAASRGDYVMLGTMLRAGPIVIGTNDLTGLFFRDLYGANLYVMAKIPIPYGKPHDRDKDGISDKKDLCKTVPGVWEFMGCPDRDGDHIQDKDDKCPDVPGVKELQGCPDKDGDGITDAEDACPDDKGLAEFKGCPDRDGDKIIDKEDECPDEPGLKEFMGCPDKDGDGTPDKYDACPDVFGPKEFKGCPDKDADGVLDKDDKCPDVFGPKENNGCPWPDTDKDGIADKDDACPTVPGTPQYKGCPPPPPMKEAEKRILERAFNNLEFQTAKDIIMPKSLPALNDLAKLLVQHKDDWQLKLSGHTDNQGDAEKNMLLSEKRAKSVKNYLVKKGAIADKIIAEWFGQTQPIADNATPKGRQKNRRVEMKVLYKE